MVSQNMRHQRVSGLGAPLDNHPEHTQQENGCQLECHRKL